MTKTVTVNALPSVPEIGAGSGEVCVGSVLVLSESTTGGTHTWSSANTATATVNASTGAVTGAAAGEVVISYRYTNVCTNYAMTTISVNVVTTPTHNRYCCGMCCGRCNYINRRACRGIWTSSSMTKVAIGAASGVITGGTSGTARITYTYINEHGCSGSSNLIATTNALPAVASISGSGAVCVGATINFSNATPGGTWSSSSFAATAGVLRGW